MTTIQANRAAAEGDLEELKRLAHQNAYPNVDGATAAARHGHVHVLEWVEHYIYIPKDRITIEASNYGQVKVLDWMEQTWPENKPYWGSINSAASEGHLEVVKWFMERNIKPTTLAVDAAVEMNQWHVLEYLAEQDIFPCDHQVYAADRALEQHRWHMLNLLYEEEIYPSEECIKETQLDDDTPALNWLRQRKLI